MPGAGRVSRASPARSARHVPQLPPGYRTVFALHVVEGHEHEEIARMLGVAVGTSKSQLHKARMKLRTLIKAAHRVV
jgi:RNA polymerase sigma-70 factor (ECF subfamily)